MRVKVGSACLFGFALLCGPRAARAALQSPATQAGQQPPVVRETVEVVATRLPKAPHDVPASVEVITGDDLRNLGSVSRPDYAFGGAGILAPPVDEVRFRLRGVGVDVARAYNLGEEIVQCHS